MKLQRYEILVAGKWEPVRGATSGVKEGWLQWKDNDGCSGLSRPGQWRKFQPRAYDPKLGVTQGM